MKTTLLYAKIQLLRILRDPVTLVVLFAIPILLLTLFGAFIGRDTSDVRLKIAVINESQEQYAKDFTKQLGEVKVLEVQGDQGSVNDAEAKLRDGEIDGVIRLPGEFGAVKDNIPRGSVDVRVDSGDQSTPSILLGVINSIVDANNAALVGTTPPISVQQSSVEGTASMPVDILYPMFTAMAIMMVGIFGVASTIPSDKKMGILRRMRVTPLKVSQLIVGMVLAYLVIALLIVAVMTAIAMLGFGMEMRGEWLSYGVFVLLGAMLMIAFGVVIGGISKNTTQSDLYGQIIFIASLGFSGLWFPRTMMPDWLRDGTAFLPLTPLIEGMERIVVEGLAITSLGFQLAVMAVWLVVVVLIGVKTFRWE